MVLKGYILCPRLPVRRNSTANNSCMSFLLILIDSSSILYIYYIIMYMIVSYVVCGLKNTVCQMFQNLMLIKSSIVH